MIEKLNNDFNKNKMEIVIRKAKPEYKEGLVFAALFDKTSEGFFSKILGEEAYEIIAEAFVKPNNEYSFENVSFAVEGENICGMVSGYTFEMKKKFQSRILAQSKQGKKGAIQRFHFIESLLMRAMGVKKPTEYYLQSIIVAENYRGLGLGKKLMNWIENDAIEKSSQIMSLDVASKNMRAISLYQHQGMTIDSYWPRFPLFPSVFTRMVKKL